MVKNRQNAIHFKWGSTAVCDGWRLVNTPALSVIEERMPPGAAELPHYHQHARQFFYVLTGVLTFELAKTACSINAGEGIEVAAGIVHHVSNRSENEASFLVISSPATDGDRITVE
jgi:quercetin dioxygenase-like cupin family protein